MRVEGVGMSGLTVLRVCGVCAKGSWRDVASQLQKGCRVLADLMYEGLGGSTLRLSRLEFRRGGTELCRL